MSSAQSNPAPDPTQLGRTSSLRILVMNTNTVCRPPEGPNGTLTEWQRPDGERCQANFQFEEPELEAAVLNGEQVEWINPTNQPCTVSFREEEVPQSPFEGGERSFSIAPHHSIFSGVIKGKKGHRYGYIVKFEIPPDDGGGRSGDPEIIIKG
jgi:hypothetical protein